MLLRKSKKLGGGEGEGERIKTVILFEARKKKQGENERNNLTHDSFVK